MSRPTISTIKLTDTLTLSECHPDSDHKGPYWLYDYTRGMNLAMGANTERDAFVQALTYYQKRLSEVEKDYSDISNKVENFIGQFSNDEDTED